MRQAPAARERPRGVRLTVLTIGALLAAIVSLPLAAGSAWSAAPLTLGVTDYGAPGSTVPAVRDRWIGRAAREGATLIRVTVRWAQVAPTTVPPGFDATDPGSPAYSWGGIDALVRALAARRISILML